MPRFIYLEKSIWSRKTKENMERRHNKDRRKELLPIGKKMKRDGEGFEAGKTKTRKQYTKDI